MTELLAGNRPGSSRLPTWSRAQDDLGRVALLYRDALGSGGYPRDARWLANSLDEAGVPIVLVAEAGNDREGLGDRVKVVTPVEAASMEFGLVHSWGLFDPAQVLMMRRLARHSALVVSPLAHLLPAHLRYHRAKKIPYAAALRMLIPRRATVHSFSPTETASIGRWLGRRFVFEATLGVFPVPPLGESKPRHVTTPFLLFFGRNDVRQKGIDTLVAGYAAARALGYPNDLVIAGAPEGESASVLGALIARHGVDGHVHVLGPVDEPTKWWLLRSAECFVFPSRHDGPPRPVREALAVGTAVIVTHETTMGAVVSSQRAGIAVPHHEHALAHAILRSLDEIEGWRKGAAGMGAVLSWPRVAEAYSAHYRLAVNSASTGVS